MVASKRTAGAVGEELRLAGAEVASGDGGVAVEGLHQVEGDRPLARDFAEGHAGRRFVSAHAVAVAELHRDRRRADVHLRLGERLLEYAQPVGAGVEQHAERRAAVHPSGTPRPGSARDVGPQGVETDRNGFEGLRVDAVVVLVGREPSGPFGRLQLLGIGELGQPAVERAERPVTCSARDLENEAVREAKGRFCREMGERRFHDVRVLNDESVVFEQHLNRPRK